LRHHVLFHRWWSLQGEVDDHDLLKKFVADRDEQAFAEMVRRYIHVVFAAASRQVKDPHLADDVTQAVFILLARKASSITGGKVLAGWLLNSARLCARAAQRDEFRRKRREAGAAAMKDQASENSAESSEPVTGALDDALAQLSTADRTAVTLRYLQGQPLRQVAATLRVSEMAATKRVSRAVGRLRDLLERSGVSMTPVVLTDTLLRQTHVMSPVFSTAAAKVALARTGDAAANAIANDVARIMSVKIMWTRAAWAAVILIGAGLLVIAADNGSSPHRAGPASQPATLPNIRIGYYLSELTALTPSGMTSTGKPYGYSMVLFDQLRNPSFEMVPVIERGTEKNGELPQLLATYFPGKTPVIASDPAQLKTLDVLVAGSMLVPGEVLDAIEASVNAGMGFMIRSPFAVRQPGRTPQVLRLYGLSEGTYNYQQNAADCDVLVEHPILDSRTGKRGEVVKMRANGCYGILATRSTGLIKVRDASQVKDETGRAGPANYDFYTAWISELGQGRVVCCAYNSFDTRKHLNDALGPEFLPRSMNWLAKR
jgi:RNA polymerase sigma factor (sigma-70 family)